MIVWKEDETFQYYRIVDNYYYVLVEVGLNLFIPKCGVLLYPPFKKLRLSVHQSVCLSVCLSVRVPMGSENHGKPGKSPKKFHAWKNHGA